MPIGHVLVSRGTSSQALVDPPDVIRPALLANASRIIVAHNHPSGNPEPSKEDIALTKRLKEAGSIVGVQLLDHLVIGKHGYASLRDMGMFQ
jgi:DNA repair protein RadC